VCICSSPPLHSPNIAYLFVPVLAIFKHEVPVKNEVSEPRIANRVTLWVDGQLSSASSAKAGESSPSPSASSYDDIDTMSSGHQSMPPQTQGRTWTRILCRSRSHSHPQCPSSSPPFHNKGSCHSLSALTMSTSTASISIAPTITPHVKRTYSVFASYPDAGKKCV
jgi:hypothetical protein